MSITAPRVNMALLNQVANSPGRLLSDDDLDELFDHARVESVAKRRNLSHEDKAEWHEANRLRRMRALMGAPGTLPKRVRHQAGR